MTRNTNMLKQPGLITVEPRLECSSHRSKSRELQALERW